MGGTLAGHTLSFFNLIPKLHPCQSAPLVVWSKGGVVCATWVRVGVM